MKIANLDPDYSPSLGGATSVTSSGAASAAVADHVADSSGAHTAPAIGVVDAAGWFGATTDPGDLPMLWPELYGAVDVETALAQLAALATADSAILGDLCTLYPEEDGLGLGQASLTVAEIDGAPSVAGVRTIRVSNGTLTDDGAGQVTITTGGGGAAGRTFPFFAGG